MHEHISTKDISYLKDLDRRITINKEGKYNFFHSCGSNYGSCSELHNNDILKFLQELDDKKSLCNNSIYFKKFYIR
jgi:hypothetical protein